MPVILVVSNREIRETLRKAGMLTYLSEGFLTHRLEDGVRTGMDLLNRISCCGDSSCPVPDTAQGNVEANQGNEEAKERTGNKA